MQENLLSSNGEGISEEEDDVDGIGAASTRRHLAEMEAEDWNRLESVLEVRSKLAEQVDAIGMANIIHAYQNVRHADYGTGQAAKRSLFKFDKRPEDLICLQSMWMMKMIQRAMIKKRLITALKRAPMLRRRPNDENEVDQEHNAIGSRMILAMPFLLGVYRLDLRQALLWRVKQPL